MKGYVLRDKGNGVSLYTSNIEMYYLSAIVQQFVEYRMLPEYLVLK